MSRHLRELPTVPAPLAVPPVDARLARYLDVADGATARMHDLRLGFVGAGGIGGDLVGHAARHRVREIVVIDRADVKPASLATHRLGPDCVGRPKAAVAAERAKELAPETRVRVACRAFEDLPLDLLADLDWVLLASDNLACERAVTEACLRLGVPLIQASLYGRSLVAQVRVLTNAGGGPCLACCWSHADWERLDAGTTFSCVDGVTTPSVAARPSAQPTLSPPELCSIAADLAFIELTRRVLGITGAADTLVEYCGYTHAITISPLSSNANCAVDHRPWRVLEHSRRIAAATPRELLHAAGSAVEVSSAALQVDGHVFAREAQCACGERPPVGRFVPVTEDAGACERCGGRLATASFGTWSVVPAAVLEGVLDRSLESLGAIGTVTAVVHPGGGYPVLLRKPQNSGGAR